MLMRWGRRWLRLRKRLLYAKHFLTIYLPLVWDYDRLHHRRFWGLSLHFSRRIWMSIRFMMRYDGTKRLSSSLGRWVYLDR
jgi:hypothetical protein